MTNPSKYQLKLSTLLVLAILAILATACSPAFSSEKMIDMLGEDTLFVVNINNLDYALGSLDQFLAGASPIPMGTSMMLRMQLGQMFGTPELAGINTAGNFTIFGKANAVTQPGQEPDVFMAIAVPVTDYDQFIEDNPNCSEADSQKISKLTSMNKSMMQVGQYALLCINGTDEKLLEISKSLQSGSETKLVTSLDKAVKQSAMKAPFWAYCNMESVNKNFGPALNSQFQEMKAMMAGNPDMASSAAAIDAYFKVFGFLLNESESVSMTLTPSAEVLKAQVTTSAKPGTSLAEMFQTNTTPKEDLTKYLSEDAMINFSANLNPKMIKAFNNFGSEIMLGMIQSKEKPEQIQEIFESFSKNTTGPLAAYIKAGSEPGKFFNMATITKTKDSDTYQKDMEKMIELYQKAASNVNGMTMEFELDKNSSEYKDVNINSLTMNFKAEDPNSPQAQAIKSMFSDGMKAKYAFTNNCYLYTFGGDSTATMNQLIDKSKTSSSAKPEELKKAYTLIEGSEDADILATINILRMMKAITNMIPTPGPQMPEIITTSNIVIAAKLANGQSKIDVAVPKDHIKELMTLVQTMQMQRMQQSAPQGQN